MGATALSISPKLTTSIDAQMRHLALESSYVSNVIDVFRNVIPNLGEQLHAGLNNLMGTNDFSPQVQEARQHFKKVDEKLPHAHYLNYSQVLVSVPEGFKGNFLEYVVFLHDISDEVFRDALQTLGEYNVVLATFISDKESKTSLKDHSDLFHRVEKRRQELTAKVGKFFPEASTTSKQRLGQVVSRFAEVKQIMELVEKLDRDRKRHNLREVAEVVRKSCDMLDIIIKDVQNKGVENVSGSAAMNISKGAHELGKFVEFVALYRTMVEQAVSATAKLMQQLDEIL